MGHVVAAAGRWGKDVWLTFGFSSDEGSEYRVVHYNGKKWVDADHTVDGYFPAYQRLEASSDGRVAGIATFQVDGIRATSHQLMNPPMTPYRLDVLSGASTPKLPAIRNNETPFALLLQPHGRSAVLVDRVVDHSGSHSVVLERDAKGTQEIVLPVPPGSKGDDVQTENMVGNQAGLMYVLGLVFVGDERQPYLARVEEKTATLIDVPKALTYIDHADVAPDGTLWIAGAGQLFKRAPDGPWEHVEITLPSGESCWAEGLVVVRAPGDVFITAGCKDKKVVVLRSRCPTENLDPATDGGEGPPPPPRRPPSR
jgi:hypothetical protein